MATIIDHTFFVGEINIPDTNKAPVLNRLNFFIAKYEEEYLIKVLGVTLFLQLKDGLAAQSIDDKWTKLKTGEVFTNRLSIKEKFYGLANTDFKKSPIANYVYYHFQRDAITQTASVGEVQSKTENANIVSPSGKMVYAWNDMVKQTSILIDYLYMNNTTYPDFNLAYVSRELLRKINIFNI